MKQYVVLVDEDDRSIGSEEKIAAHAEGLLHRAFSIFIFNTSGLLLVQKRNAHKYHCGNLWSNTCCSHPTPDESLEEATHRRLGEELNFDCNLIYAGRFRYRAQFENGLIENEIDHVLYGIYDGKVTANPHEISDHKWIDPDTLLEDLTSHSGKYTPWLHPSLNLTLESYRDSGMMIHV